MEHFSFNPDQYLDLCTWLVKINQKPQEHCLHSWAGESAQSLAADFCQLHKIGELIYLGAKNESGLVEAMGAEFDKGEGNAWLKGPNICGPNWEERAENLFLELQKKLPAEVNTFFVHLNEANQRARDFYKKKGFKVGEKYSHVYLLKDLGSLVPNQTSWSEITSAQHAGFRTLFEKLFKNAYYSSQRLLDMTGNSHQIFPSFDGSHVSGFCVVAVSEDGSQGEIEFLGVDPDLRQKGLGRQLLLTGLHWLKENAGVATIALNVNDTLVGARHLYESVGFRLLYTGASLTKRNA